MFERLARVSEIQPQRLDFRRCSSVSPVVLLQNDVKIRVATGTAEYRAAGYLRAQCFYHYPPDRSEFAQRAHLRMKGDDMWQQLEEVALKQEEDGSLVIPMIATVVAHDTTGLGFGDASICIPSETDCPWVVATLDVNIGTKLKAEELIGREPRVTEAAHKRAYLSNVCVLPAARRRGLAKKLINAACDLVSIEYGVQALYVHVVADNFPARNLYEGQLGFKVEQQETETVARALNRPRRLLLYLPL